MTVDSNMILPYRFKKDGLWSSSEESDNDDSDSQSSLTEQLGNTSWCSCIVMPHAVECTCCHELTEFEECFEESGMVHVLCA